MKAKKPERLLFRIAKYGGDGVLLPNDGYTARRLRERNYRVGDILLAELRKPRHPGFHRLAHRLGTLVADNIEEFSGLDGHAVLKRLQIEGNIECDEIPVNLEILNQKIQIKHRIPRSLSYASMDEAEFKSAIRRICNYIADVYWPSCTPEEIEAMAEAFPEAA